MALAINATLSDELANSYVTQAYADDYWDNHFSATKSAQWAALSDGAKTTLLIQACNVIETARFTIPVALPDYALHYDRQTGQVLDLNITRQPVKFYYYQRLQFPRNLDVHYQSSPVGTNYIPEEVMNAQCEQAIYLLNFDDGAVSNRLQGVTMEKVSLGKGQIDTTQEYAVTGSMFSPIALEMLRKFMVKGGKLQRQ